MTRDDMIEALRTAYPMRIPPDASFVRRLWVEKVKDGDSLVRFGVKLHHPDWTSDPPPADAGFWWCLEMRNDKPRADMRFSCYENSAAEEWIYGL